VDSVESNPVAAEAAVTVVEQKDDQNKGSTTPPPAPTAVAGANDATMVAVVSDAASSEPASVLPLKDDGVEVETIEVPVKITIADQTVPLNFTVRAVLCSTRLEFSSVKFDFGPCYTSQTSALTFSIRNPSPVLQKLSFASLPGATCFDVQPDDGFVTLAPYATETRRLTFTPKTAMAYRSTLKCKSLLGEVRASLKCPGLRPLTAWPFMQHLD